MRLLNSIKKPFIDKAVIAKIRGGDACCCGCCGPSGKFDNYDANYRKGYTCSCGDTIVGI